MNRMEHQILRTIALTSFRTLSDKFASYESLIDEGLGRNSFSYVDKVPLFVLKIVIEVKSI